MAAPDTASTPGRTPGPTAPKTTNPPDQRSVSQIEADIAGARERLATTVDELAFRSQPKEIARRQVESARAALVTATRTEDGQLRIERVVAAAAAAVAVLGLVIFARRRRG